MYAGLRWICVICAEVCCASAGRRLVAVAPLPMMAILWSRLLGEKSDGQNWGCITFPIDVLDVICCDEYVFLKLDLPPNESKPGICASRGFS
jgi:hypothetical protein